MLRSILHSYHVTTMNHVPTKHVHVFKMRSFAPNIVYGGKKAEISSGGVIVREVNARQILVRVILLVENVIQTYAMIVVHVPTHRTERL